MKKILMLLLAIGIIATLVGCGGGSDNENVYNRSLSTYDAFLYEDDTFIYVTKYTDEFKIDGDYYTSRTLAGFYDYDDYLDGDDPDFYYDFIEKSTTSNTGRMMITYSGSSISGYDTIIPRYRLGIGDVWQYWSENNKKVKVVDDYYEYISGYDYWTYEIEGSSVYYRFSPEMGFFTNLFGEDINKFGTVKSINEFKGVNDEKLIERLDNIKVDPSKKISFEDLKNKK